MNAAASWLPVCALDEIVPDTGVAALIDGRQIAVFRLRVDDRVYAIDNTDPFSGANVLARGLVGDLQGERVVASPIYKQHFALATGRCLEDPGRSVQAYATRLEDGMIWLDPRPLRRYTPAPKTRSEKPRLVVVGNGMAGMRVIDELLETAPDLYQIEVFGAEPHGNYNRILLSPLLAGEKKLPDLMLHAPAWYAERGIAFHGGDAVLGIDRRQRIVRSASGLETAYDRLLIATGSRPVVLPIPGVELAGVTTFRDLADVEKMIAATATRGRAVVIGGGLLGLEAAHGLAKRGMQVSVVHLMDRLMERQLDAPAAELLRQTLEEREIAVLLEAQTEAILGAGHVNAVRLKDGTELPADLVVMAVGIKPEIALAQRAGLRCERGILVNDTMQTFDPRVYAVGECVQHRGRTYGLVDPLWGQAYVCAAHLAERGYSRYRGSQLATQLKVAGVQVFSAGDFMGGEGSEDLVLRDPQRGIYKRLVLKDNRVTGAVLFGDTRDGPWYFELINDQREIGAIRSRLLFGREFALRE
ncbi:nitrite reductase [NAD(P)H], small subunit [Solimonas aquatica]|uniref:Nitrite reductase [NAD(P)H], small subunit n=1 Tax=Solimonas aquatica TaxID=489703 RepID=A0A1H9D3P4_9GAMM|nr:nitrite reductase small subunit NirD [Solimonas aquatica]SEQ08085.1 nitrite reductase [NAD(P)H], small subunit [Solimonas aquatica]